MKLLPIALTAVASLFAGGLSAQQLSVSIDGFGDPSSFDITNENLNLRVTKLISAPGETNTSTHILIEGLAPLGVTDTSVYSSTYSAVDINNNGAIQDQGVLYLKMPPGGADLPPGTFASAIVGVVQRPGDWDAYDQVFNPTTLGGSDGTGQYDGSTLSFSLSNGGSQFLGNATYTVVDPDTLAIEPFTLTQDGATSHDISATTLLRDGNHFYGTLVCPDCAYDSLIFSVRLHSIPDADMDGVPDITDAEVTVTLDLGVWNLTDLGYVLGGTATVGYSPYLGWISVANYPNVYQFTMGEWLQVVSTPIAPDTAYWMSNPNFGWIYTHSNWGGFFFHGSAGRTANNFLSPNP